MYVVRRAFRNFGEVMLPGSVVEPSTIKRFKSRLNDHYIVHVSDKDRAQWDNYFRVRLGTEIHFPEAPVYEAPVDEAPVDEAPVDEAPVYEAPVYEAPVKAVVKATRK